MSIKLNDKYLDHFISSYDKKILDAIWDKAEAAYRRLTATDPEIIENDESLEWRGWMDLPEKYPKNPEFEEIKKTAEKIRAISKVVLVVGIGGSYLGARAAIEFIKSPLYNNLKKDTPDIYFLGNSISADNYNDVKKICEDKNWEFSVIVISKSGTTTEPAVTFRKLRGILEEKYGDAAKDRIFVVTDKNAFKKNKKTGKIESSSKLNEIADKKGYKTFVVPDDVGGRYSVLTPVGLLPIAVAGADIYAIMAGAAAAKNKYLNFGKENDCLKYAVLRNLLYQKGKSIEIMAAYEPAFAMMNEWWKQLFGESEGKDKKGIYPASVIFSTDLHSLGQFIQDGSRIMFETVINIEKSKKDKIIPADNEKIDGMDFVDGKSFDYVNGKALLGTVIAHTDGGTPNMIIDIDERSEKTFGELVYFFELACAISGYILDVNPFDQPGVEAYKKNMFALLGKPDKDGTHDTKCKIEERIREYGDGERIK